MTVLSGSAIFNSQPLRENIKLKLTDYNIVNLERGKSDKETGNILHTKYSSPNEPVLLTASLLRDKMF